MNDKVLGYILSCSDYRDNDYLLQVLCKDYGRLTLVLKGAKKINSKSNKVSLPNNLVEFIINLDHLSTIYTVNSANMIKSYSRLNEDLNLSLITQMMQEIILKTTLEHRNYNELFNLIIKLLDDLNMQNYLLVICMFVSQYLKILGINPYVNGCVICNNSKINGISVNDGGFICNKCNNIHTNYYSVDILKKFRLINLADLNNYLIIQNQYDYSIQDLEILMHFLKYHFGLNIKSYELFKRVNN